MVEYIYIKQVAMSILTLLVPYGFLVFYVHSIEKSLTIYLSIFLVAFIIYSLLLNNQLIILIYIALYIFVIIAYKLKSSGHNKTEINNIRRSDIFYFLVIITLSILSYFIPINQNWDFYTFYYQILYSPVVQSVAPLFNNIQLVILFCLKDFEVLPRVVAIFFLVNFLLLLYKFFEKNIIFPLIIITNLSIYISLINEGSYLELSSLTILTLFLMNYYRYGLDNIYTKVAGLLLFFTKGNLSLVIGTYVNIILLVRTIIKILRQKKRIMIHDLIYLFLVILVISYFANNYIKYFAINFEVFFIFKFLTLEILHSPTWFSIVSGSSQLPLTQAILIKLYNVLNPIYGLFIVFSLLFYFGKYSKSKAVDLHLSKFESGLLGVYAVYILSPYFPTVDTFSNIFVIRYYIFFISLIFLIFLKKISARNFLFYYLIELISLLFYTINIIQSGPFMKERLILNYLNNLYIYHMLAIGVLLLLRFVSPLYIDAYKIHQFFRLTIYMLISVINILILTFIYPIIINAHSLPFFTDSSQYNCLLNDLFPELYTTYFRSYCENDFILINISRSCHFIYSIGGIYAPSAFYITNATVLIRGGHVSLLPFILGDIKMTNSTIYYYIINKYTFLKAFELPSNFCLQLVSQNHKEYAFIEMIKTLNQTSKSFSIIYNDVLKNPKPLATYYYYVIYNVTNPLGNK
jgi:hypothetical protein